MPGGRGKGRGGPRQGKEGVTYTNREDLNSNKYLPTGGPYGSRQGQEALRDAGPMPTSQPLAPAVGPPGGGGHAPHGPPPPPIDPFAPTARPDEPITAGIPMGPGPSAQSPLPADPHIAARALYQRAVDEGWPYADDLRSMLEQAGG